MGNHRFRLSDMIPNAWFYKLKDMGRIRNQSTTKQPTIRKLHQSKHAPNLSSSSSSHQRKSYHFTRDLTQYPIPPPIPTTTTSDPSTLYNSSVNPKSSDIYFPDPPRKSSKKKRTPRKINRASSVSASSSSSSSSVRPSSHKLVSSSVSASCSCRASLESVWTKPDSTPEDYPHSPLDNSSGLESILPEFGSDGHGRLSDSFDAMVSWSSSCHSTVNRDIVLDMEIKSEFSPITELQLPPIITKRTTKFTDAISYMKKAETNEKSQFRVRSDKFEGKIEKNLNSSKEIERNNNAPVRRLSVASPGVRIRNNSPRIASRKIQSLGRKRVPAAAAAASSGKGLSQSFAVVKASRDPQRDFRESMVEMIEENKIKGSKELEELLACYLSLNSDEYHVIIIKVFKQIWFDLFEIQLK